MRAGDTQLAGMFAGASESVPTRGPDNANQTRPFSIRLTEDERAYLQEQAGSRPLGAYIRDKLLGDRQRKRPASRKPQIGERQYAALLAALGESRLSSNLNQLAKHANMGTLDVRDDVEGQLQDAYQAIMAMREALFMALGLRSGGGS